jgi:hypothetical protein
VRTPVAHEPPVVELLPDSAQLRAQIQDIYDTYGADGADTAMATFMAHVGLDEAPRADAPGWEPRRSRSPGCAPTTEVSLARLIRPTTRYRPDIEALRAAPMRIAVAAGATSAG